MSVPPSSNPPPGGFPLPPQGGPPPGAPVYYGQPPPANNNGGCLKAFGITCGVLLLLGIIGGVALFKMGAPFAQQFMKMSQSIGQASINGRTIQQAVVAYQAKNGKYPSNLTALVADGEISDAGILHSDQDPNPNPGHISWRYQKPVKGAPGNTPLLDLPYSITIANHTQPAHLIVNLDGSTPSQTTIAPASPPASSP